MVRAAPTAPANPLPPVKSFRKKSVRPEPVEVRQRANEGGDGLSTKRKGLDRFNPNGFKPARGY